MGYRCPVCDDPQPDGEHLANHMAFTGLLGDDAHEEWLDGAVPDWSEMDPASLGDVLSTEVPPVEFEDIETEDTPRPGRPALDSHPHRKADHELDADTAAVLEEARALTREMYGRPESTEHSAESEGEASGRDQEDEGEDR